MTETGIRPGDELEVVVSRNGEIVGAVVITGVAKDAVSAEIYCDDGSDLLLMHEAIKSAQGVVDYHVHSPRLKQILEDRISEIKQWIAEGEGSEPPSPTTNDIPF